MHIRRTQRIPHSKRRLQKKRVEILLHVGLIVVPIMVLVGVLSWVSGYEKYSIQSITTEGNIVIDEKDIIATVENVLDESYFYLFSKRNTALYPRELLVSTLYVEFPRFNQVTIKRDGVNGLVVFIREREPYMLWCGDSYIRENSKTLSDGCYFLDKTGLIFTVAPYFSGGVYTEIYGGVEASTSTVGSYVLNTNDFGLLGQFVENLEKNDIFVNKIILRGGGREVILEGGGFIRFAKQQNLDEVLHNILVAIDTKQEERGEDRERLLKNLDYIDAQFKNKIFFKFN